MDILTGLFVVAVLYGVLYFFDTFFKTCAHYPYIQFLRGTGFEIKLCQIRWTTTAFNRLLVRWGSNSSKFFGLWFNFGLLITLILLPISIILLLMAFVQNFTSKDDESPRNFVIEPVLPGVNLPFSELGYYSFSIVVCSVVHELGHALASVQEDVHLVSVGVHIFLILPVAFVEISTEKLNALNRWKALKIMCAGVWHNLVLSFVTYLLLCSLPRIFSLTFYTSNGVTVAGFIKNSPLLGPKGLHTGDNIININNCNVRDDVSWLECLQEMQSSKPAFCTSSDLVHSLDESVPLRHLPNGFYDCCSAEKSDRTCFEYLDNKDGVIEMPPHVCLPVRIIVESSPMFCNVKLQNCPDSLYCIRPILNNVTNLFKIKVVDKPDVIYIGTVGDVLQTVQISRYVPKYVFKSTAVPDIIGKFLMYIIVLSFGFAVVNVIPCAFMDGKHISTYITQIVLKDSPEHVNLVSAVISLTGTALLVLHALFSVYYMLFS